MKCLVITSGKMYLNVYFDKLRIKKSFGWMNGHQLDIDCGVENKVIVIAESNNRMG